MLGRWNFLPGNHLLPSIVLGVACAASFPATAAEYGSISGQFVLEGEIPEPEVLIEQGDSSVKDSQVCAADDLKSQALRVDPKTKGIRDVFVYLLRARNVHPDLKESKQKEVIFDQRGCQFEPHSLFVRTDQHVRVLSDDPIAHNTHTFPLRNQASNFILKAKDRDGVIIENRLPELIPIQVKCDIHPWMRANWLILDHPYAAITDAQGKFTIEKLPAGTHKFRVWHEKVGYLDRAWEVTVEPNRTTELEPVEVPVDTFQGDS